ncbi:MAG: response regulator [Pseudanabaena sp. ELA607]
MSQDQQRIMGYFIEEAREHLQTIEQGILNLQDVLQNEDSVNELFRAAHSIKGGSAMLGVGSVQHISHRLEDFFKILKDNANIVVDEHLKSLLLAAFDRLQELLDELQVSFHIDEEVAAESLSQLNPVFTELEHHLENLRTQSQPAGVKSPSSWASPERNNTDDLFQTVVNDDLREMLQLFKGTDDSNSRDGLQEIAQRIQQYGIKFGIPAWSNLLGKVAQALVNSAFSYRELAPVVIREIKQAQEKFISGEGHQIAASTALLDLLPKRAVVLEDDEISMIFGAASAADDDISMGLSLDQVLADRAAESPPVATQVAVAETNLGQNLERDSGIGSGIIDIVDGQNVDADDFLESIPAMDWGHGNPAGVAGGDEGDVDGPKIGESELKTLANLFDNEEIDFDAAWEDIESNETQVANQGSGFIDDDSLADLLGTSVVSSLSDDDTDSQMITLFGDEFVNNEATEASSLFPDDMGKLDEDVTITATSSPQTAADLGTEALFPDVLNEDHVSGDNLDLANELADLFEANAVSHQLPEELEPASPINDASDEWNEFSDLFSGEIEADSNSIEDDFTGGMSDQFNALINDADLMEQTIENTPFNDQNDWDIFDTDDRFSAEVQEEISSYEIEDPDAADFNDSNEFQEDDSLSGLDSFDLDGVDISQQIADAAITIDDQDMVNFSNQLNTETDDEIDPSIDTLVEDGFSANFAESVAQSDPANLHDLELLDSLGSNDVENKIHGDVLLNNDDLNDDLLAQLFETSGDDVIADPDHDNDQNQWDSFEGIGDDYEPDQSLQIQDSSDQNSNPHQPPHPIAGLGDLADLWEPKDATSDDSFVEALAIHTYEPEEDLSFDNLDLDGFDQHQAEVSEAIADQINSEHGFDLGAGFLEGSSNSARGNNDEWDELSQAQINPIADAMAALEHDVFLGSSHDTSGDHAATDNWESEITEIFQMELSSEDLSVLEHLPRESDAADSSSEEKSFGNRTIDNLVDFFDSESEVDESSGDDFATANNELLDQGNWPAEIHSGITSEASYSMDQTNQNFGIHSQGISDDLDLDALAALIDEPTVLFNRNENSNAGEQGSAGTSNNDNFSNFDSLDDLEALINNQNPAPVTSAPKMAEPALDTSGNSPDMESKGDDFADLANFLGTMYQKDVGPMVTKANQRGVQPKRQKSTDGTMRVDVRHLDSLNNLVGELVVNRNLLEQDQERLQQSIVNLLHQVQLLSDVAQRMRDQYDRSLLEASLAVRRSVTAPIFGSARSHLSHENNDDNGDSSVTSDFDGIEFDRYTTFHVLSQEIIELTVKIRESASDIEFVVSETEQVTRQLGMITTQIQDDLKQSRMVPFAQIADVLPRGVRDRAIKSGKQAELEVHGRETLIDKAILEELKDPLIHIVNNAVDHGLENMSTRTSNGKPAAGKVTVRAYHQGNQTVISISDDGGGIDPEKVKESAVRKGVRTQADVNRLTENEVYALLFEPGFSTAAKADEFKGRGVGLDVVKTALDDIRGSMMIESGLGKGTTFTIRLPLTLSISRAIFCISDRARVAFPVDGFEDMVEVPQSRIIINEQGQTCLPWRDAVLPFQHLSNLLTYNRHISRSNIYGKQENDEYCIIILRNETSYLAVQVDQFLGEFEIVIKQLEGPIPKPVGIAGATVLGDGKVMAIANVLELFDIASGRLRPLTSSEPKQISTEVESAIDPTVLIVDDSITVRELLSLTFAKVGYRVEQAKDGQDAWEKLRAGLPCDLIFCDIEMPRMDGLELLSRLQKDGRLSQIPVAMLTSRGADRHRQTAVQYGAKGYFTKPYLEEELLSASNRLLKGENLVQ